MGTTHHTPTKQRIVYAHSSYRKTGSFIIIVNNVYLQLLHQLLEVALGGLVGHDLEHLLADVADLAGLSIASGLGSLERLLLGEGNGEEAEDVAVSGAHVDVGLDQGLPLSYQGAELVAGHVHAVEVSDNVQALDILTDEADLAEGLSLVTAVEVSEGELEDTALQTLRGDL